MNDAQRTLCQSSHSMSVFSEWRGGRRAGQKSDRIGNERRD